MHEISIHKLQAKAKQIALITLNKPARLNALSGDMIFALRDHLRDFDKDSNIAMVFITGSGDRAFCAGGDLKMVYEYGQTDYREGLYFYSAEYDVNLLINNFSKPYVALMNGVAMGGGLGLALHGTRAIGSDTLQLAMPEVKIGFFPDVGAAHFLDKCPHHIGMYLGLTGNAIDINDAIYANLVDACVPHKSFNNIIDDLLSFDLSTEPLKILDSIIARHSQPTKDSMLARNTKIIAHSFGQKSVEDIISSLEQTQNIFATEIINTLKSRSPTSLKVTMRALRLGAQMSLSECLKMEFNLTRNLMQQHDLYAGIRSVIIDKNNTPLWQPSSLNDVSDQYIDSLFK